MPAIPFFETQPRPGTPPLHFAHANGYPPQAYGPLFELLAPHFHVTAMEGRALWPGTDPREVKDWGDFVGDLQTFLAPLPKPVVGVGHSLGGTVTLIAALQHPDWFRALVLIDPPFFPPFFSLVWQVFYRLGLVYHLHPLVKGAVKRRTKFENPEAMFAHYRPKKVFEKIDDRGLWAYVHALARPLATGGVELRHPPAWEARVYVTGAMRDWRTWRDLRGLRTPILLLRPEHAPTTPDATVRLLQRVAPQTIARTIPATTHLAPLENPEAIA
ncbi:MAG: alpha/beta hydrolase, partial [Anaerolineales bacterium]|nr:alpha/beta hydrolase [Anaerolineales bacterium]